MGASGGAVPARGGTAAAGGAAALAYARLQGSARAAHTPGRALAAGSDLRSSNQLLHRLGTRTRGMFVKDMAIALMLCFMQARDTSYFNLLR